MQLAAKLRHVGAVMASILPAHALGNRLDTLNEVTLHERNSMKIIHHFFRTLVCFTAVLVGWYATAQTNMNMNKLIINDESVDTAVIAQMEQRYAVKFVPGNYWYDKMTGAFGLKDGPCTGFGVAGITLGGSLKTNASTGSTGVFINGRELHPLDVAGLQTFMQPQPGRYWMDATGNFGYEPYPTVIGNVYRLYQARFGPSAGKKSSSYKNNVWSGETTRFGSDGTFMYYSSKKSDGTTSDYSN